jgi:outer membrane lipoprotein-sorting protein
MNCTECKDLLLEYTEGLLSEAKQQDILSHLDICPPCQSELQEIRLLADRLTANGQNLAATDLENMVLAQIVREQKIKLTKLNKLNTQLNFWRNIMKNKITKLAVAAIFIFGMVIGIKVFAPQTASAADVFAQAVKAVKNLKSVYIKAQMRTIPHDNFELIKLDRDFVPHEIWKDYSGWFGKWRIEKPRRVVVMDGKSSLLFVRPNYAVKGGIRTGFVSWLRPFLDIEKLLDSEIALAREQGSNLLLTHEQDPNGINKLIVTVEASAQGDFSNDWLKNKSISGSDNRRVYRFDAQTKLLEDLKVYVHVDDNDENDVLVFQITEIQYNPEIDPNIFTLELPEDVIWGGLQPEVLPDNDEYQNLSPKETATAFFQACADEDWDEFLKFWIASKASEKMKNFLGGLELISIGEPFKSGRYPGWFVPYEIRLKNGTIKKFNLAVRNDNKAKRFVVDGGI